MTIKSKKILVVGLAKTGVACARFLAKQGAEVTATDLRNEAALADVIAELAGIEIRWVLGAPMLGAPALDTPPTAATAPPPEKSKTGLFIGGGVIVAALIFAGAFVMTRPKEQPNTGAPVVGSAPTTPPDPDDGRSYLRRGGGLPYPR